MVCCCTGVGSVKPASFNLEAQAEFQQQVQYYEERSVGLGVRFSEQIEAAVRLACAMPTIGSPFGQGTRRVFPKDFPFSVVYRETHDALVIFAIASFRRKPNYWHRRASGPEDA